LLEHQIKALLRPGGALEPGRRRPAAPFGHAETAQDPPCQRRQTGLEADRLEIVLKDNPTARSEQEASSRQVALQCRIREIGKDLVTEDDVEWAREAGPEIAVFDDKKLHVRAVVMLPRPLDKVGRNV